ncbi:MAG TPA: copper resistance CopC family protein [Chthoniobacterales bacterium]|jgi:methionine-rich copper-binding protein CopC|nr:copper resistance CopC family protein [Chthoniobacterales bacterium]
MSNTRIIIAVAASSMFVHFAAAHAFLDHADPKVGSTLHEPPAKVTVWMTENLEPAFSKLQVFDAKRVEVDEKDTKVSGATMTVSLPKLPAGTYRVSWQAVATDTHRTSGTFDFTIE